MKRTIILFLLIFISSGTLYSNGDVNTGYSDDVEFSYSGEIKPGKWLEKLKVEYEYNGKKYTVLTRIYFPEKYTQGDRLRTIIALHGYDSNYLSWGRKTRIETFADQYGFAIVCPNTGKTLFETEYFPETKYKWSGLPGSRFIGEVLLKYIRSRFALASTREKTGILGASTGGRGAIIVASLYNKDFTAASGLSGLYDKVTQPKNGLIADIYGDYTRFKSRWENNDSVIKMVEKLGDTAVFLFHGGHDYVFSDKQSLVLVIRLNQVKKKAGGKREIVYKIKKYKKHEWSAWNYALEGVMKFFNNNLSRE
jgi:S-formylglutathione hydrolase FrmB